MQILLVSFDWRQLGGKWKQSDPTGATNHCASKGRSRCSSSRKSTRIEPRKRAIEFFESKKNLNRISLYFHRSPLISCRYLIPDLSISSVDVPMSCTDLLVSFNRFSLYFPQTSLYLFSCGSIHPVCLCISSGSPPNFLISLAHAPLSLSDPPHLSWISLYLLRHP
jgi:hypothetical protein